VKEIIIEKSKTIVIPVIIGSEKDLESKGLKKDEVYAPILVSDMVLAKGAFEDSYPKAVFIDTGILFDMNSAEFFNLIAYAMRFALENSTNLYGYIINHLYELCDMDHDTLEELFEEIYKVHKKILNNKTKEERAKISLLEALGEYFLAKDLFTSGDSVAFGCIAGANYSYQLGLLQTEDYYEIRDMFVPFGLSISQTKLDKKTLYKECLEYLKDNYELENVLALKKIGKASEAVDLEAHEAFNEKMFESVSFDEYSCD
jgi:3-dehydroquinate synthase